jgi:hypothetical protein
MDGDRCRRVIRPNLALVEDRCGSLGDSQSQSIRLLELVDGTGISISHLPLKEVELGLRP